MYSWDGDTSDWYGRKGYSYRAETAKKRASTAARAKAAGPRKYGATQGPNEKIVTAKKQISTTSKNPLIIAVDVTGSMADWPAEIFDRLPLLFTTLQQYRDDVEICFAAIGDGAVDNWPLQVTNFASGFDLEQLLGSLYGEGGGGDAPESYGLFAHWVNNHVTVPNLSEQPFMIVFGDVYMHEVVPAAEIKQFSGDDVRRDANAIKEWNKVAKTWNTWFLRRPGGKVGDKVDKQWSQAIGQQKILHIEDEQRAVDYAMGLIARAWGHFDDFQNNMLARQSEDKVEQVSKPIAMICPGCGAPLPITTASMVKCSFCDMTVKV